MVDLEAGAVICRDAEGRADVLALSPDARRIAASCGSHVRICDTRTLQAVREIGGHEGSVTSLAWSADSKWLASTADDGRLAVVDVETGELIYAVRKWGELHAAAFHPRRSSIAYGGKEKQVYVYDFASRREEEVTQNLPFGITCLAYSPDGDCIAIGDDSCDIWVYRVPMKTRLFHEKHHVDCWVQAAAWSGDGESLAFACRPKRNAPTIHAPLRLAEVLGQPDVLAARRSLIEAVGRVTQEADPVAKQVLETYLNQIAATEAKSYAEPFSGVIEQAGDYYGLEGSDAAVAGIVSKEPVYRVDQARVGAPVSGIEISPEVLTTRVQVPQSLVALVKAHERIVAAHFDRHDESFCVNSWKVRR